MKQLGFGMAVAIANDATLTEEDLSSEWVLEDAELRASQSPR